MNNSEHVSSFGLDPNEAEVWFDKYKRHVYQAVARGLNSELSFENYLAKAVQAGISSPEQIGTKTGQFVMGRVGDVGNYTQESCRFITTKQNHQEAKENGRHVERDLLHSQRMLGRNKDNTSGIAARAENQAKEFVLIEPSGVEHRGKNVLEFAAQHDLNPRALYKVFAGTVSHHRGWTGYYP